MSGEARQRLSRSLSAFNRKARFFPRLPTARHVPECIEAFLFQNACRNASAVATRARNRGWLCAIELTHALSQLRQKNVTRARNVPVLPFTRRTNIDNLQTRGPFIQFVNSHLTDLLVPKSSRVPGFHSPDQITGELSVARMNKEPHDFLEIAIAFEYEKDWLI